MRQRASRPATTAIKALVCLAATSATAQAPLPVGSVEPVVLMKSGPMGAGEIEGCGLTSTFAADGAAVTTRFLLLKDEKAERGTRFVLSASWPKPGGASYRSLKSMSLTAGATSTEASLGQPVARQGGVFETSGTLPASDGDIFMRDLMIGGAAIALQDQDGDQLALAIPGPVSQSVRASYLNCAGDLFRPDPAR
jgi:hypothetical protein